MHHWNQLSEIMLGTFFNILSKKEWIIKTILNTHNALYFCYMVRKTLWYHLATVLVSKKIAKSIVNYTCLKKWIMYSSTSFLTWPLTWRNFYYKYNLWNLMNFIHKIIMPKFNKIKNSRIQSSCQKMVTIKKLNKCNN